jgi:hypothetical protein
LQDRAIWSRAAPRRGYRFGTCPSPDPHTDPGGGGRSERTKGVAEDVVRVDSNAPMSAVTPCTRSYDPPR